MSNTKRNIFTYFIIIVSSITLLGVAYLYFSSNRYYISNSGDDQSYKIDRWTGKTWLLINGRQINIDDPEEDEVKTDSETAINLAKSSYDLPNTDVLYNMDNDYAIRSLLGGLKGDLNIIGWSSRKITEQTYLVRYQYQHNGKVNSFNFDINLSESIVRYVNNDPYLLNKYQQYIPEYSSLRYLYDELKNQNVTGLPDFEIFQTQLVEDLDRRKEVFERIKDTYYFIPTEFESFNELYFPD